MKNFNLSQKEIQSLRMVYKATRDIWAAHHIKAIIALGGGWTLEEVSEISLLNTKTLKNDIKLLEKGSVKELTKRCYQGSVAKLSKEQLSQLKHHSAENMYITITSVDILFIQWRLAIHNTIPCHNKVGY